MIVLGPAADVELLPALTQMRREVRGRPVDVMPGADAPARPICRRAAGRQVRFLGQSQSRIGRSL